MRFYTRAKYGNTRILVDGVPFDSKREGIRWRELQQLQMAGEIKNLQRQIKFLLQEGFRDNLKRWHRPITYIADFVYLDKKYQWRKVVEDAKGFKTPDYKIKKKLLIYKYKDLIFIET